MRILLDEEGLDWDAAWAHHRDDLRLHQPHAAARGAGAVAGAAVRAPAAAAPADHLRDQPALPAPGAHAVAGRRRAAGAHVDHRGGPRPSRCAWPTWPRSARTASTAWPSCTPTWSSATCSPTSTSCCPSASTTRPTASRRGAGCCTRTRASPTCISSRIGTDWIDRDLTRAAADRAARRRHAVPGGAGRGQAGQQARPGGAGAAPHRRRAAARGDVRGAGQAHPRVQAPAAGLPAGHRPLPGAQAQSRARTSCRAPTCSPARRPPATPWPSCTSS